MMKALHATVRRILRGPRASAWLRRCGIHPRRYWLLVDLFGELSDRGEVLEELGRNQVALRVMVWIYAAMTALISVVLVGRMPPATYLAAFLLFTAFIVLTVLLLEAGNSLVNPVESLALAHQPVDSPTHTAAKLTHLGCIVLYLVPALNAIPAAVALISESTPWFYPAIHLASAFGVGIVAAMLCCSFYGWIIRLMPAERLKGVAQFAAAIPFLGMICWKPLRKALAAVNVMEWLPAQPALRGGLYALLGAGAVAVVVVGIRSLSADYLLRIAAGAGRPAKAAPPRRSLPAALAARFFGGQAARAGCAFVCQMARRDFQFRRQVLFMVAFLVLGQAPLLWGAWRADPFVTRLSPAHLLPHLVGFLLFMICSFLAYGTGYKGAWIFLLVPPRAFAPFARGVYAALWFPLIVLHAAVFLLLAWPWGLWHAGLFAAYSAAVSSLYLALDLRMIKAAPFSQQFDATRGTAVLPLIILGGIGMAIAAGLQILLVFRSPAVTAAVAPVVAAAAYFLTRASLGALEDSIRRNLPLPSEGAATLFKEIPV